MGLLDDAIREHLELKRRAGADAVDVAREEREVLGRGAPGEPPPPDFSGHEQPYAEPGAAYAEEAEYYAAPPAPSQPASGFYDAGADGYTDEADLRPSTSPAARVGPPPPPPRHPGSRRRHHHHQHHLRRRRPVSSRPRRPAVRPRQARRPRSSACPRRTPTRPTCSRRRPTSSRRRPSTTASGSSRRRRRSSTSTSRRPARLVGRGAIAQLGERLLCKQEVTGSIPVGSISESAA